MNNDIRDIILQDSKIFPYFLSNELTSHIEVMIELSNILSLLANIDCEIFLDDEEIEEYFSFIYSRIELSRNLLTDKTFYKFVDWIRYRISHYIMLYLKEEKYEQASNLKKILVKIFPKRKKRYDSL